MSLYVGNMSFDAIEEDLRQAFSKYGEISSVRIVLDRETGRPRGFIFMENPKDEADKKTIVVINGTELSGRTVTVNETRPERFEFGQGSRDNRRGGYKAQ